MTATVGAFLCARSSGYEREYSIMRRNRSIRVFGTMLLLFVLATATYAFTAANTVPDSNAGFGSGDITGYEVTDIAYTISGNELTGIAFNLTPDTGGTNPDFVSVSFDSIASGSAGTVYTNIGASPACTITDAAVSCTVDEVTDDVDGLNIAAYQ